MMRILLIVLLLLPVQSFAGQSELCGVLGMWNAAASGGVTCSGDWSSGQYESFENTTTATCTTDWTDGDTAGVINVKSTDEYNCGTASMEITGDSDTSGNQNWAGVLDSADGVFSLRFYFKLPVKMANYTSFDFLQIASATPTALLTLRIRDENTSVRLQTTASSAQYFTISVNTWYYCVIEWNTSGTSYVKLYNTAGAAIETNTGGDYSLDQTMTTAAKHFYFLDTYGNADARSLHIDDVVYSASAADLTGTQTCN